MLTGVARRWDGLPLPAQNAPRARKRAIPNIQLAGASHVPRSRLPRGEQVLDLGERQLEHTRGGLLRVERADPVGLGLR
jgi:hypothetical protein